MGVCALQKEEFRQKKQKKKRWKTSNLILALVLPHGLPDEVFKGSEGDHASHALARWGERIVQENVAHTGHVDHPVMVKVRREGHSKQQVQITGRIRPPVEDRRGTKRRGQEKQKSSRN